MRQKLWGIFLLFSVVSALIFMTACGAGGSNGGRTDTTGEAQGVYAGISQSGYTFEGIILPDDKLYALHGTTVQNVFYVDGMMAGQGKSDHGTYTAPITDYTPAPLAGSLTASYVPGQSITGTVTGLGASLPFSGTAISSFNFKTPAALSDIAGLWSGTLLDGTPAFGTINGTTGAFTGSAEGCNVTGTFTPDSARNFFRVTLTFGASPCLIPNQSATGVAVSYQVPNSSAHQLIVLGTSSILGTTYGTVFVASR